MDRHAQAQAGLPGGTVNRFEVLRELATARTAFELSDRDVTVLQALVSFHPGADLGADPAALVVHPSNRAICERLNGMPASTMRRHLARLVSTGLILRRDSPNGKRYARRHGDEKIAFGFDLSPLLRHLPEIRAAAEAARAEAERHRRLRETVSLMRRDLAGLAAYGATLRPGLGLWDRLSDLAVLTARDLRRKLSLPDLASLRDLLRAALDEARDALDAADLSTSASRNEQHHQNSDKYLHESERGREGGTGDGVVHDLHPAGTGDAAPPASDGPNVPLGLVLAACPEIRAYSGGRLRHWHDLVRAAETVRPMMGIDAFAWDAAKTAMGAEEAAVVLAAMLERFAEIRAPGAYLRHLTARCVDGRFSCGPMVMALTRRAA